MLWRFRVSVRVWAIKTLIKFNIIEPYLGMPTDGVNYPAWERLPVVGEQFNKCVFTSPSRLR